MAKITNSWDVLKNILLSTRMKSFYWSTGTMILAVIVNQAIVLINNTGLNTPTIVVLGLVLNQISKALSNALKN